MYDPQEDTGRAYNNQDQMGLGGNLVQEGNIMAEGEEIEGQYQPEQQYVTNEVPGQTVEDNNSFHVGQYIEKINQDPKFSEKEKQISQKVDILLDQKQVNLFLLIQDIFSW